MPKTNLLSGIRNLLVGKELSRLNGDIIRLKNIVRELESTAWVPVGSALSDVKELNRWIKAVKLSREFYINNPYYRQAIRLYTAFIFGRGASFYSKDEELNKKLDEFTKVYDNQKTLFEATAQGRISNKLIKDGELYVMFFVREDKSMVVRLCDPMEITGIITEPEDPQTELYYVRKINIRELNFNRDSVDTTSKTKTKIYRSIEYFDYEKDDFKIPEVLNKHSEDTGDCYIMHIIAPETDILDLRGLPPLLSAIAWARLHIETDEDFLSYLRAVTSIISKEIVKGTEADISAVKTTIEQLNTDRIPPRFGTRVEAEGGDEYQPIERSGGLASVFEKVSRATKLNICAGSGIYEHYFGDPSSGNLATATSMELPMLKVFEQWQEFWKSTYRNIIGFYFKINKLDQMELNKVEVVFPDLLKRNIPETINSIVMAYSSGIIDGQTSTKMTLGLLGYDKIDEAIKSMYEGSDEADFSEAKLLADLRKTRNTIERKIK